MHTELCHECVAYKSAVFINILRNGFTWTMTRCILCYCVGVYHENLFHLQPNWPLFSKWLRDQI